MYMTEEEIVCMA